MRILLVTEFFTTLSRPIFSGGVETRAFYIARELSKKNKVIVLTRRRKGEAKLETRKNLIVVRLGCPVNDSIASISSLWQRAAFILLAIKVGVGLKIDVVEGSNFVSMLPAFTIGRLKGVAKIAWYPDILIGDWEKYFGPILGFLGDMAERILLRLPWDRVIAISQNVANKLIREGIASEKIVVLPCGVEAEIFSRKRQKKFPVLTLCVISRLVAYKRVEDAVWATKLLKGTFPQIKLVIIGEGQQKNEIVHLTRKLGLTSAIKILNKLPLEKLIEILASSHLLIHPSLIEGFGIVLVEAAAVGTPFVAADIPAVRTLAESLKSGTLFLPKDKTGLGQAITKLLTDKKEYAAKQKAGRRNARLFSWKEIAQKTEKEYGKIKQ